MIRAIHAVLLEGRTSQLGPVSAVPLRTELSILEAVGRRAFLATSAVVDGTSSLTSRDLAYGPS